MRIPLLIISVLCGLMASASHLTVCPDCGIKSIQLAIDQAQAHDTIMVQSGRYFEQEVHVDKPLTITGEGLPIIDAESEGSIFVVSADSVTIQGVKLVNIGVSYTKDYAAIRLHRVNHFSILNNVLEDVFFGIMLEKSHHGVVKYNSVSSHAVNEFNSGNGIHAWHCADLDISYNKVFGLRDGIYLEFVDNSVITYNESHDNLRYGLHFMFSNYDDYFNNTFVNNGAGVAVMFSKFINMRHNVFRENWGSSSYGLLLKEIYDAEIEHNEFDKNTIGVYVEGSTRVNYINNDFHANGWGVNIRGACYENSFERNNFLHNSFDVSYSSGMNSNLFSGNYWSSYAGYDLDKDGVGDVPYRPVKLFSYVVNQSPESIILMRSLFVDLINFSEKVSPAFTPDDLMDAKPAMRKIQ
jgi:nitrous oxidase accessory protein